MQTIILCDLKQLFTYTKGKAKAKIPTLRFSEYGSRGAEQTRNYRTNTSAVRSSLWTDRDDTSTKP